MSSAKAPSRTLKYKKSYLGWKWMQILHLPETAELLDTGQSVTAVIKIYLEHWQTASKDWRWHQTLGMGASCFTSTNLPSAPNFFWYSTYQPVHSKFRGKYAFWFCQASWPLILTLLVMWQVWIARVFFHQERYWSLHTQLLQNAWSEGKKKKRQFCIVQCWDLTLELHSGLH